MLGAGAQGGILLCLLPCSHQSRQGGKDRTQGSGASASQSEGEGLFVPQALYATPPQSPFSKGLGSRYEGCVARPTGISRRLM